MKINNDFKEIIETASSKALATVGIEGVNVVPVSVVKVLDDSIFLYDFFMNKTADNVKGGSDVALAVWSGLVGIQIKGSGQYLNEGDVFTAEIKEIKEKFPERILKGVLVITPTEIYDVSADVNKAGLKLI
ncbi:MAG: pyridoxamine 5'-phosphate oxidase family protein [Candidatus Paceibacteria bacterium]